MIAFCHHPLIGRGFRRALLAASLVAVTGGATAGTDFGTHEDVLETVDRVQAMIDDLGPETIAARLRDPSTELGGSPMGIALNLIDDGRMYVVAHNKHPDINTTDFTDVEDLRGNRMMSDFIESSDAGGDYVLNYWPHYVGEHEYEYHCFNTWAVEDSHILTVCR